MPVRGDYPSIREVENGGKLRVKLMKTTRSKSLVGRGSFMIIAGCFSMWSHVACGQMVIPINNSNFSSGSGQIVGQISVGPSSAVGPVQIGATGWYGLSNATNTALNLAGFRPGIEVNFDASSASSGELSYFLGASLGGLLGLEMPEATLWQPLTGYTLQANSTYSFSVDVNAGALLDVSAFSDRGFGLGITTGSSTSSIGTYYENSLSSPSLLDIDVLSGTTQRLTFTFTTGATVPGGTIGVAVFAGRGNQALQANLLSNFRIDDASLSVVPEPSAVLLAGLGLFLMLNSRAFLRRAQNAA